MTDPKLLEDDGTVPNDGDLKKWRRQDAEVWRRGETDPWRRQERAIIERQEQIDEADDSYMQAPDPWPDPPGAKSEKF